MTRRSATYDLDEIRRLAADGRLAITRSASRGAAALQLDRPRILEAVEGLTSHHFYKTMPAVRAPGLFQDVYRCHFMGYPVYIKLQIGPVGEAVVVSFKRDTNPGRA